MVGTKPAVSPAVPGPTSDKTEGSSASVDLRRSLSNRHLQMIAFGGTLGVGLFFGSARAIAVAGPSLILLYIPAGVVVFLILRALGEMTVDRPVAGSFTTYAHQYLGPFAGFLTGWTYWFAWVVTCMAELTAMGSYVDFWVQGVPHWLTASVMLALVLGGNMLSARWFGETEFWFALIKIAAILGLLIVGLLVLVAGVGGGLAREASFANLWQHDGVFPHGVTASLLVLQNVMFAFFGLEFVGVAAGEAKDPERSLPKAINAVALRMFVFYFGSLLIIMSLIPWNEIATNVSPFVVIFAQLGIPAAATIMNFVVLTAALSSSNSGVFSTSRMLHALAHKGLAPKALGNVTSRRVPGTSVVVSAGVMLAAVLLNLIAPSKAFTYLVSIGAFSAILIWMIIVVTHLRFRQVRSGESGRKFALPLAPWTNYFLLLFLTAVVVMMALGSSSRVALYVGSIWFAVVCLGFRLFGPRRKGRAPASVQGA